MSQADPKGQQSSNQHPEQNGTGLMTIGNKATSNELSTGQVTISLRSAFGLSLRVSA